jgi:hypothetical protein
MELPLSNLPAAGSQPLGRGVSAAEMKRCHWVNPLMVCHVKFTEWTRDNRLRQPVFLGIGKDKNPSEVFLEKGELKNLREIVNSSRRNAPHKTQKSLVALRLGEKDFLPVEAQGGLS